MFLNHTSVLVTRKTVFVLHFLKMAKQRTLILNMNTPAKSLLTIAFCIETHYLCLL